MIPKAKERQSKINKWDKNYQAYIKKENLTCREEENQTIEINPGTIQMIELTDKVIKTITITAFHMLKKLEESLCMVSGNMEDWRKMMKIVLLKMKTITSKVKSTLDRTKSRLEISEKNICEFEDFLK